MSKLINRIFAGVTAITLSVMLFGSGVAPVRATMTADQIAAAIADLQQQLLQYQAMLNDLGGSTTPTVPSSYEGIPDGFTFTNPLYYKMSGDEVKYLQIILKSEIGAPTYPATVGATGWFGPVTKASVIAFQEKYADDILASWGLTHGTGYVGKTTRDKLNELLAGSTTPEPPVPTDNASDYDNEADCTDANYFWYNDVCNELAEGEEPVGETGDLNVELSDDNPVPTTFVEGQATADLAHYTFVNDSDSEIKVTNTTFKRIGISADATLSNVYLFDGAIRLTDAATVSSGSIVFNASAGLFTIPANSSKTIAVKSSIDTSTSGQTIGVSLISVVAPDANVVGSFPIAGNINAIATATLAGVTVGTPLPSSDATTDPQSDVRVWESTFNITTRKVDFKRLSLRQINSVEAKDLENFRLLIDGEEVASVATLDSNGYVTFSFDKELQTGARTVKVLADVIGGSGRIIQMSLRNVADIDVVDSEYGVNILAGGTFAASTAKITINSGTMSVEKSSTSPSGNIVNGATDAVLGEWIFTAHGEPIKVETLLVDFAHTTSGGGSETSTLRNGRIMVDGVQAGSTTTLDPASTGTSFTTNFTVTPGTPVTVQVRADIYDNDGTNACSSGDKITATLSQGSANASKTVSLGTLAVPSSNKAANQLTIAAGSMTLAKKTNYTNQTIMVPQTAFKIGEWTLTGGTSEDVNVHTFSLDIDEVSGTSFDYDDITDMYLVYGSNTSTIKSTPTAADNDWSVSFTLAKNEVMPVALYGNIGSSVTTSTDSFKTILTATGTGSNSAATVTSGAIDGQTIIYGEGSITVARDASTADAAILDDNQTVQTVAYKFEALHDSYTITEVVVTVSDATNVSNAILKDGDTVLKTMPGAQTVTFTGLSVPVPADSSKVLTVNLELSNVGAGAGTSGAAITTDFSSGKAIAGSTGVEDSISGSPASGNAMYVYKAIPSISKVVYDDVALNNQEEVLLQFSVASNGGTIAWDRLLFNISKDAATTLATSTTSLYDVTSGSTAVGGTFTGVNLDATSSAATLEFDPTSEVQISGTRTYQLISTPSNVDANSDYITTSLRQNAGYHAQNQVSSVVSDEGQTSIIWSDISASGHATSTSDWTGDYLIKSLPITNTLNGAGFGS